MECFYCAKEGIHTPATVQCPNRGCGRFVCNKHLGKSEHLCMRCEALQEKAETARKAEAARLKKTRDDAYIEEWGREACINCKRTPADYAELGMYPFFQKCQRCGNRICEKCRLVNPSTRDKSGRIPRAARRSGVPLDILRRGGIPITFNGIFCPECVRKIAEKEGLSGDWYQMP